MVKNPMPQTSLDAFASLDPNSVKYVHERIKQALVMIGEGSYEDIACYLKMDPSRVWKRLHELGKAGVIFRPGNRKVLSSGRTGYTWKLAEGHTPEKVTESILPGKSISDYSKQLIQAKLL